MTFAIRNRRWVIIRLVTSVAIALAVIAAPASAATSDSPTSQSQSAAPSAANPASKPHLVVSVFHVSPGQVRPGASFELSVDVYNTSKKKVENLLVSIGDVSAVSGGSQGGGNQGGSAGSVSPFATRSTGNSRYWGTLGAGATGKAIFELAAAPKAEPGLYTARIDLDYTSGGNSYSSSQAVGIPVSRSAKVEFLTVSVSRAVVVGNKFAVNFEGINSGSFTLAGVVLKAAGNELEIANGVNVIGSLDAGDSDSLEASAVAKKVGVARLTLSIGYRDDFNQEQEITKQVEVRVNPKPHLKASPAVKAESGGFLQAIGKFFKSLLGIG